MLFQHCQDLSLPNSYNLHLTGDVCVGFTIRDSLLDNLVPLLGCRLVMIHHHLTGNLTCKVEEKNTQNSNFSSYPFKNGKISSKPLQKIYFSQFLQEYRYVTYTELCLVFPDLVIQFGVVQSQTNVGSEELHHLSVLL